MNADDHTLHDQRFLRLVADNQLKIRKLCNAYSWNRDDHEDLYQEILCQLWRALPGVTQEAFADTWVYRVALNTCITFVRKDSRVRGRQVELDEKAVRQIPAPPPSQADHLEARRALLFRAIVELNPMERAVIMLFLEDLAYDQIAEVTGLTNSNVGVILHRAKKKLSERMRELT